MLQKGSSPCGGLFLFPGPCHRGAGLAIGVALAAGAVRSELPMLKDFGAVIGAGVSGTFLWIIGVLNLLCCSIS